MTIAKGRNRDAVRKAAAKLRRINARMISLLDQAEDLVERFADRQIADHAYRYWLAQIRIALTDDHKYAADSEDCMLEAIKEMEGEEGQWRAPKAAPPPKGKRQVFSVHKVNEGGLGQRESIRTLKSAGIYAEPCHSPYVGQSGVLVIGTQKQIDQAENILFGD